MNYLHRYAHTSVLSIVAIGKKATRRENFKHPIKRNLTVKCTRIKISKSTTLKITRYIKKSDLYQIYLALKIEFILSSFVKKFPP